MENGEWCYLVFLTNEQRKSIDIFKIIIITIDMSI